jgi:hypothetical protein
MPLLRVLEAGPSKCSINRFRKPRRSLSRFSPLADSDSEIYGVLIYMVNNPVRAEQEAGFPTSYSTVQ